MRGLVTGRSGAVGGSAGQKRKRRLGTSDRAVYEGVYDAVLDGRLPPGARLPETSLGDIFGVSRIVVRKALGRLAHEHIVTREPNQVARVASPSIAETRDIFDARRLVESEVVRLLADTVNESQCEELRIAMERERRAHRSGRPEERVRLSIDFHMRLASCCTNGVYRKFLKELVSRSSLTVALYKAPGAAPCYMEGEHQAIADAVMRGDGDTAARLAVAHLHALEATLDLSPRQDQIDLADVFQGVGAKSGGA